MLTSAMASLPFVFGRAYPLSSGGNNSRAWRTTGAPLFTVIARLVRATHDHRDGSGVHGSPAFRFAPAGDDGGTCSHRPVLQLEGRLAEQLLEERGAGVGVVAVLAVALRVLDAEVAAAPLGPGFHRAQVVVHAVLAGDPGVLALVA